jgi:hypothetical protein
MATNKWKEMQENMEDWVNNGYKFTSCETVRSKAGTIKVILTFHDPKTKKGGK